MNKVRKRKVLTGIGGACCAVGFFGVLIWISVSVFQQEVRISQAVTALIAAGVLLYAANGLNVLYDTASGFASVHRRLGTWCRNLLFGGLLYLYACVFARTVTRFYDAESLSLAATVEGIMLMGVSAAVFLHLHNERYLRSRASRVKKLAAKGVLNSGRRYSMIVEKGEDDEKKGFTVYGRVSGEIKRGDRILIYKTGQHPKMARVRGITVDGKKVRQTSDTHCALQLGDRLTAGADKLDVISGVRQYREVDSENSVENPSLRAYLMEYSQRFRDPVYFYHLLYAVIHGNYLVPGFYPDGNRRHLDIMDKLEGTQISFPSVNSKDHPRDAILAIFTDWDALSRWRDMMASERSAAAIMDFQQVLRIERMGYKGIVINPFGPIPFFLNRDLVERILATDEYQASLRKKEENPF